MEVSPPFFSSQRRKNVLFFSEENMSKSILDPLAVTRQIEVFFCNLTDNLGQQFYYIPPKVEETYIVVSWALRWFDNPLLKRKKKFFF